MVQELLGLRNARALNSFRRDTREFVGLKSILNSVRVRQKRRDKPERVHVIHGIVPNAGAYEFTLDNWDVTTVEVGEGNINILIACKQLRTGALF